MATFLCICKKVQSVRKMGIFSDHDRLMEMYHSSSSSEPSIYLFCRIGFVITHGSASAVVGKHWVEGESPSADSELRKPGSTSRLIVKSSRPRLMVAVVLTVAGILQSGCKSSPAASQASTPRPAESHRASGAGVVEALTRPLLCPGPALPPTISQTGGHRVILSWKASVADSKHVPAAGYCVYRGTGLRARPTDLLNPVPFPGTTCMDDSVQNGAVYTYAVRAISAGNVPSVPSEPTHAVIPNTPRNTVGGPGDSTPLCRQPDSVK